MELQRARHFVDRPATTGLIAQRVHDLLHLLPVPQSIVNIYGLAGIGKTALLAETVASYQPQERLITIGFSLDPLGQDLQLAKVRLLKCFMAYAARQGDDELGNSLEELGETSDESAINRVLQLLVAHLSAQPRPILLLIDAWECVPEALFAWAERSLLLPLLRDTRLLCVFASQSPLRWRQFELRRRVWAEQLTALDLQATAEQIGQDVAVAKAIYAISFGHPLANEALYAELAGSGATPQALTQQIELRRAELADMVVHTLYGRLRGGVSAELEQIAQVIALFREFDIQTLRSVLPQFYPGLKHRSDSALLLSIKQLLEIRLITWSDDSRAYRFDQTMRKVFSTALALAHPERHAQICAAALRYYEQLIRELPANRNVYVVEYFYHSLYKGESGLYNEKTIQDRIMPILRTYYYSPDGRYRDDAELDRLRTRFEHDAELASLLRSHNLAERLFVQLIDLALEAPLPHGNDRWPSLAALS